MAPEAKIIYVLRNPVERALSQAKLGMAVRKNRRIDDVPEHEFLRHIDSPGSRARTRYSRTLDLWSALFPCRQLLILFYEDLARDPRNHLRTICRFIGVDFDERYFGETMTAMPRSRPPARCRTWS
jgi:Sulfotransferase family